MADYAFDIGDRVTLEEMQCCTGTVTACKISCSGIGPGKQYRVEFEGDHEPCNDPLAWWPQNALQRVVDKKPRILRPYTMGDHLGMIEQAAPLEDDHCCEDWDELSSHYHCANCRERCSMMGHINRDGTFSCIAPVPVDTPMRNRIPRRENYTVGGIPGVMGTNLPIPPRDPGEPVMQYIVIDVSSHDPVDWVGGWQGIDPEEHYNWGPGKWVRFRIKPTDTGLPSE